MGCNCNSVTLVCQGPAQIENIKSMVHVEICCWLVEKQDVRASRKTPCDQDPLAFASRELRHAAAGNVHDVCALESCFRGLTILRRLTIEPSAMRGAARQHDPRTVNSNSSFASCGTVPGPGARSRTAAVHSHLGRPDVTRPLLARQSPAKHRSSVDFPEPLGPTRASTLSGWISSEISLRIHRPPRSNPSPVPG